MNGNDIKGKKVVSEFEKIQSLEQLTARIENIAYAVPNLIILLALINLALGFINDIFTFSVVISSGALFIHLLAILAGWTKKPLYQYISGLIIIGLTLIISLQLGLTPEKSLIFYLVLSVLAFSGRPLILFAGAIAFILLIHFEEVLYGTRFQAGYFHSEAFTNQGLITFYVTIVLHTFSLFILVRLRNEIIHLVNISVNAVQTLYSNRQKNLMYARDISTGKFETDVKSEEMDDLGKELIKMSSSIKQNYDQERLSNWMMKGNSDIGDLLRKYHNNVDDLASHTCQYLVKYLSANQAGFFVLNDDNENNKFFELKGAYAYERKKHVDRKLGLKDGLIGQAYMEKELIYLKKLPDNYVLITSGLGQATPSELVISPLQVEGEVVGVIEIASFNPFDEYMLEFISKVSENIGMSLITSKRNEQTNKLLHDSQQMAEEMRAQEEEMRQNMEELEATQEDLQRKNKEREQFELQIRKFQNFLQQVIESIPNAIYVKDTSHQYFLINDHFSQLVGKDKEDILFSDGDELFPEGSVLNIGHDEDTFNAKKITQIEGDYVNEKGQKYHLLVTRAVFEDEEGSEYLAGSVIDITNRKEIEERLKWETTMFHALMDYTPDRIIFKDTKGLYQRVSKEKFLKHGMKSHDEIIGKSDLELFGQEHADKAKKEEQSILKSGKAVYNIEQRLIDQNDNIEWGATSRIPFKDESDKIVGSLIVTRDITNYKESEANLSLTNKIVDDLQSQLPFITFRINKDNLLQDVKGNGLNILGKKAVMETGKPLGASLANAEGQLAKIKGAGKVVSYARSKDWVMELNIFSDEINENGYAGYCRFVAESDIPDDAIVDEIK